MRLFPLFIKIAIYIILLVSTNNATANHKNGRTSDNRIARTHFKKSTLRHETKKIKVPGDIWERIRTGMQIPQPEPVPAFALNDLSAPDPNAEQTQENPPKELSLLSDCTPGKSWPESVGNRVAATHKDQEAQALLSKKNRLIQPEILVPPEPKYTELGLMKLHPDTIKKTANSCKFQQNGSFNDKACKPKNSNFYSAWQNRIPVISSQTTAYTQSALANNQVNTEKNALPCNNAITQNQQVLEQQTQIIAKQQKQSAIYERVRKHIATYTQKIDYLQQIVGNASPYLYYIVENLNQFKLPYELALLPIIESGYQPTALSVKNAAGLWQFMPSTGQDFNLNQSEQYDDRLDIEASTKAAMQYLAFLKQYYNGDWLLALAAYNCGLGLVDQAISFNSAIGLETDYWSLTLPEETQEYVPRLLALAAIFANPANYQFKPDRISDEPYFVKVKIERAIDIKNLTSKELKAVAQFADLDYKLFSLLNPGFLNAKLVVNKPFNLLMPTVNAIQLRQRLNMMANIVENAEKSVMPFSLKTQSLDDPGASNYSFPFFTLELK